MRKKFIAHTAMQCLVHTWKKCSCFSALQKKGCMRTAGAEGRFWGSLLSIDVISSLATTLSGARNRMEQWWHEEDGHRAQSKLGTAGTHSSLTMHILLQAGQLAGTCQDVGLAPQAVPKGVLSSRHHVVENAAGREDVHGAGLQDTGRRWTPHSPQRLLHSVMHLPG